MLRHENGLRWLTGSRRLAREKGFRFAVAPLPLGPDTPRGDAKR